jgi:hypothetical protein
MEKGEKEEGEKEKRRKGEKVCGMRFVVCGIKAFRLLTSDF